MYRSPAICVRNQTLYCQRERMRLLYVLSQDLSGRSEQDVTEGTAFVHRQLLPAIFRLGFSGNPVWAERAEDCVHEL